MKIASIHQSMSGAFDFQRKLSINKANKKEIEEKPIDFSTYLNKEVNKLNAST